VTKYSISVLIICVSLFLSCDDSQNSKSSNGVEIIKGDRSATKKKAPQGYTAFGTEGIFIKQERVGNGLDIQEGDVVTFHYKEWMLPKRKKINDSYEKRSPKSIRLGNGQVVEGLEQVLAQQKVGAVFQIEIPWQLAYGDKVIYNYPPKSDVVMDVTVLGANKPRPFNDTTGIVPKELNSGIKIYTISKGKGRKASAGLGVEVHYHGYFADGKLFDSSYDRKSPIRIELGAMQVISGWEEVLAQLSVGDVVTVYIPYYKAYGEGGKGSIPPKTDLFFDMELLEVKDLK